jgi:hypothetical protein
MGIRQVDARLAVNRFTDGTYDIQMTGLPTLESVRSLLNQVERYTMSQKRKGEASSKIEPSSPIGSQPVTARKESRNG